jgi:hypothetical protein
MGAALMRIPEDISVHKALLAFGDGVCVPAITWIAENYFTPLAVELIHGAFLGPLAPQDRQIKATSRTRVEGGDGQAAPGPSQKRRT